MSIHRAHRLNLRDPGELIAAIPTLLNFRPSDSLVLLTFSGDPGHRELYNVLRIDLPDADNVDGWIEQLSTVVANYGCREVILVMLGGQSAPSIGDHMAPSRLLGEEGSVDELPGRDLLDALAAALAEFGTVILDALWAPSVTPEDRWRCYRDATRGGLIPDAATLSLVTALTVAGVVTFPSRDEMAAAVLAADPAEPLGRRRELIASRGSVQPDREIRFLDQVIDQLQSSEDSEIFLDDATIARLVHALGDDRVRGAALARCIGSEPAAAEWLWSTLVRAVPAELGAHPAYLLGVCAYLRGDGTQASIAFDRVCQIDPSHSIAGYLRQALYRGMRPSDLRFVLEASVLGAAVEILSATGTVYTRPPDSDASGAGRA